MFKITILAGLLLIAAHQPAMAVPLSRITSIVLDAGHGGADRGAVNKNVLFEKDFAKKLTIEIKNIIFEQNGEAVKTTLTGGGKKNRPQQERAAVANLAKGQLYISIHVASGFDQRSKQLGIFITEEMTKKEVAASWKGSNAIHYAKNLKLALAMKAELDGLYSQKTWQLYEGRFLPLFGIDMPGILIEIAALNDPRDQVSVSADDYFKETARRVYAAILRYDSGL